MLGKSWIFSGKSFEKSFFQEIPRNFPRKVIFRGKKCTKNRPLVIYKAVDFHRASLETTLAEKVSFFRPLFLDRPMYLQSCSVAFVEIPIFM
jgi:hypothetical protein